MDQLNKQLSCGILPNALCFNRINKIMTKINYYITNDIKNMIFMVQNSLNNGSMKNYFTQLLSQYLIMQKLIIIPR